MSLLLQRADIAENLHRAKSDIHSSNLISIAQLKTHFLSISDMF